MPAGKYDFEIEQGSTFSRQIIWKDSDGDAYDLTDYTAALQIRKDYNSAVLLELTTENGGISITGAEGKLVITISDDDSSSLGFCKAIYDLEIYSGSETYRLLYGNVKLSKEVTRNVGS